MTIFLLNKLKRRRRIEVCIKIIIGEVFIFSFKVANVNSELTGDRMTKCLQVKRGCFYAAKANIFCANAARSIVSPNENVTKITEFSPQLLKSPRVSTYYTTHKLSVSIWSRKLKLFILCSRIVAKSTIACQPWMLSLVTQWILTLMESHFAVLCPVILVSAVQDAYFPFKLACTYIYVKCMKCVKEHFG